MIIGINMIYESMQGDEEDCVTKLTGISLLMLALGVSLDALTVGFSLGTLGFPVYIVVLTFGVVGGLMSALGLVFGKYIGKFLGEHAEKFGGLVLIVLGD